MNGLQRRFAEEFAVDHRGTQAAIRAGYSVKRARVTASELLKRPDVVAEVERLDSEARERLGVTHEYVIEGFREYHERALRGEMPGSVGVRSLEGLAKSAGLLVDRSSVEHSGEVVYTLMLDRSLEAEE